MARMSWHDMKTCLCICKAEFDHGTDELVRYLDMINHPALGACNIEVPDWHGLKGKIKDYVTHDIQGTKVCGLQMVKGLKCNHLCLHAVNLLSFND
jgi:hypothetical protein